MDACDGGTPGDAVERLAARHPAIARTTLENECSPASDRCSTATCSYPRSRQASRARPGPGSPSPRRSRGRHPWPEVRVPGAAPRGCARARRRRLRSLRCVPERGRGAVEPHVAAARRVEHDDIVEHGLRDHAARALDDGVDRDRHAVNVAQVAAAGTLFGYGIRSVFAHERLSPAPAGRGTIEIGDVRCRNARRVGGRAPYGRRRDELRDRACGRRHPRDRVLRGGWFPTRCRRHARAGRPASTGRRPLGAPARERRGAPAARRARRHRAPCCCRRPWRPGGRICRCQHPREVDIGCRRCSCGASTCWQTTEPCSRLPTGGRSHGPVPSERGLRQVAPTGSRRRRSVLAPLRPARLAAIAILGPLADGPTELDRLSPSAAVPALVPSLIFAGSDRLPDALRSAAWLAERVPVYRCRLPNGLDHLPAAVATVVDRLLSPGGE